MKRITAILFLLFCTCAPVYAANFVELGRDDMAIVCIDVDSIELRKTNNNEYVVAWIKVIPRGDFAKKLSAEFERNVGYLMVFDAHNKNMKQSQTLSDQAYDKNSKIIESHAQSFKVSEYTEVIPDTIGEDVYDFVLSYYNTNKK